MQHYDVLIIGAGIAGIAAATCLSGKKVLLAEREDRPGGILNRCMHRGFGRDMTGPEYLSELLSRLPKDISVVLNTTVTSLSPQKTAVLSSRGNGIYEISFSELILATGCMERPIGHMLIAGTRPRGIYTAGQMQEMINIYGITPPSPAVIVGSGDIGFIVAGHMLERGVDVTILEIKDSPTAMARNIRWTEKYPLKVMTRTTVSEIVGNDELEGVILTDGTFLPAKTLLTATGLIPDRELLKNSDYPYEIHICGNCRQVYPMAEAVIRDAQNAAQAALRNLRKQR